MIKLLVIKDLCVSVEKKEILKNINLTIYKNDKIALLGPNGSGKTSLLMTIMGHPKYIVTKGTIFFNGKNLLKLDTNVRSKLGIFLGFQNPSEVEGVINIDFLKNILNEHENKNISLFDFYKKLKKNCKEVNLPFEILNRFLNKNFSGGEKKRNEILQMLLIKPCLAMLDEIDSGLDVDAIKSIAKIINNECKKKMNLLIISHYIKLLNLIKPNRVIVMSKGHIVLDGKSNLINLINEKGYEKLLEQKIKK